MMIHILLRKNINLKRNGNSSVLNKSSFIFKNLNKNKSKGDNRGIKSLYQKTKKNSTITLSFNSLKQKQRKKSESMGKSNKKSRKNKNKNLRDVSSKGKYMSIDINNSNFNHLYKNDYSWIIGKNSKDKKQYSIINTNINKAQILNDPKKNICFEPRRGTGAAM